MTERSELRPRLRAEKLSKTFGATQALSNVSIVVMPGELVGLAGHNGAGKSTLLRSLAGLVRPDQGRMQIGNEEFALSEGLSPKQARNMGIHTVHQELSLCSSLRVDESAAVVLRTAKGVGWRNRAWTQLEEKLNEIFPGHGISANQQISELSIAKRQMVEIASATLTSQGDLAFLMLDEPTSSLDADATASLYRWLRMRATQGLSVIVTTHRLNEMLSHLDRLYVMRDGKIIVEEPTSSLNRERLIGLMGGSHKSQSNNRNAQVRDDDEKKEKESIDDLRVSIRGLTNSELHDISLDARAGDIIGLVGLEGHGQRAVLDAVFRAATSRRSSARNAITVHGKVAYVSGDRVVAGIFRFWSVGENISVSSLSSMSRWGWMSRIAEKRVVDHWGKRLEIRGSVDAPIVSLSGGNQQKVLMARSIATGADIILLDDPTRGVDQGTKEQMYAILREEANLGRAVIWYSTENEELVHCNRVYVLRAGRVMEILEGDERHETRVIAASFGSASET
jgi:ribose transport system ATP-binding protein